MKTEDSPREKYWKEEEKDELRTQKVPLKRRGQGFDDEK